MREKKILGMMAAKEAAMDRQMITPRKIWKKWKIMEMSLILYPKRCQRPRLRFNQTVTAP